MYPLGLRQNRAKFTAGADSNIKNKGFARPRALKFPKFNDLTLERPALAPYDRSDVSPSRR